LHGNKAVYQPEKNTHYDENFQQLYQGHDHEPSLGRCELAPLVRLQALPQNSRCEAPWVKSQHVACFAAGARMKADRLDVVANSIKSQAEQPLG
jgi:hypothetical protein